MDVIYRNFEYVKERENLCGTTSWRCHHPTVWTFMSGIQRECATSNAKKLCFCRVQLERVTRRKEKRSIVYLHELLEL